jgi:hypothetical protein
MRMLYQRSKVYSTGGVRFHYNLWRKVVMFSNMVTMIHRIVFLAKCLFFLPLSFVFDYGAASLCGRF